LALGTAQLVGCGSCVKDDPKPGEPGAPPELPGRENKLKVVGIRKPYLGAADASEAVPETVTVGDSGKHD
jgi:hypothetical protein